MHPAPDQFDHAPTHRRTRTVAAVWVLALQALFPLLLLGSDGATSPGAPRVCNHQDHRLRKLVLKDGTYDLITTCDVRGDRVLFVSAERDQRESLPASWVDWNASAELDSSALGSSSPVARPEARLGENGTSRTTESIPPATASVAKQLPEDGTVFLVESRNANPVPREIVAAQAKVNRATAVASPETLFLGRSSQLLVVEGHSARIASRSSRPDVFVRISDAPAIISANRSHHPAIAFALVHLTSRVNDRVVSARERHWFRTEDKMERVASMCERVSSDWIKLSPIRALAPGEYAIVQQVGKSIGTDVWDFRIVNDK